MTLHSVELLEQTLRWARRAGYQIRQEWLGGTAGGTCEFLGKKWLFVDLSLAPAERLERVLQALEADSPTQLPPSLPTPLKRRVA